MERCVHHTATSCCLSFDFSLTLFEVMTAVTRWHTHVATADIDGGNTDLVLMFPLQLRKRFCSLTGSIVQLGHLLRP